MARSILTLGLVALLTSGLFADDLTVLTPELAGGPPRQMLTRHLKRLAVEALERRKTAYEQLKTVEESVAWQQRLRKEFVEHLGGFPERTPLNSRVVGMLEGDRYRMEKIIFESQPRHFVTAVLYLPTVAELPFPVVVMPCGHTSTGKTENQLAGVFLAQNGVACLCYDPIGQGERYQFLDPAGTPRFRPTVEHTILGTGSIPLGRGTATYRIWDGMRAIDYIASRSDIDPARIGVSGCSGGGTLTSYLMALDDRVACAAPSCYITSFERLLNTIGPQDAEQNIHGQIAFGMDHADYVLMRAPRPTLILASTQDFFDIQGTWDAFRQAKRFYTRLGAGERISLIETDAKHGYPKQQREAMLHWMRRWMAGEDKPVTELGITPRPASDFVCTPKGQVMLLEGARSVVDLNIELNDQLAAQRRKVWEGTDHQAALTEVRRIAGIRHLADLPQAKVIPIGKLERTGYRIEKLCMEVEPGIRLPGLLFRPEKPSGRRYLSVHGSGKHADTQPDGPIEKLVRAGHVVLAVDLRGVGEIGTDGGGQWGGDWNDFFISFLLGKSMVSMRADDVLSCARFLSEWDKPEQPVRVDVVATGVVGPSALHAVALETSLFDSLTLQSSLPAWSDVVRHPDVPGQLVNTVHGALGTYDLPDLVRSIPPGKVKVVDSLKD